MDRPGPSNSPRQYPSSLPTTPQPYSMPSPPQQMPPYMGNNTGYPSNMNGMIPMQPPYYPYPYQMGGPSAPLMPYGMPPPYYAPPPHHYMYPLAYPPPLPPFDIPRNTNEYVPRQMGSPHRGSRNFSRNNHNYQHQHQPRPPPLQQFRNAPPTAPTKLSTPSSAIPPSPFPLQTATASQTSVPLVSDNPEPTQISETIEPGYPSPPASPQRAAPGAAEPPIDVEAVPDQETAGSGDLVDTVGPLVPQTIPEGLHGPIQLSEDTSSTSAISLIAPQAQYAIINFRPTSPSERGVYGLMFAHSSKPPGSVISGAHLVEEIDPTIVSYGSISSSKTRPKGRSSSRPRHAFGVRIPRKEDLDSKEYEVLSHSTSSSVKVESDVHRSSAENSNADVVPVVQIVLVHSNEQPSVNETAAPITPTITSSSVYSSSAATPTSSLHTPSPSSPASIATSMSAQASPIGSAAKATPVQHGQTAVAPSQHPASKQKAGPQKSWADLFVKKNGVKNSAPATILETSAAEVQETQTFPGSTTDILSTAGSGPSTPSIRFSPSAPQHAKPSSLTSLSSTVPLHLLLSSSPPITPPAPLTHPRGLVNTGNMCFANVVLQALLHTAPFYKLFDELGRAMPGDLGRRALIDATVVFLRDFPLESTIPAPIPPSSSGRSTPITAEQLRQLSWQDSFIPQFLYDAMSENKRFDSMRGGRQEDAEEFLGFFLDTLHEEMLTALSRLQANPPPSSAAWAASNVSTGSPSAIHAGEEREVERPVSPQGDDSNDGWLEVGKKNKVTQTRITKARESAITRIFGGKLRSILHTPGAGKDSVTLEPYQPLQLDIQPDHVRTIEDAFVHLTQPDTVQVHTTARGGLIDATKQVFIDSFPPILVVHIKRFLYDQHGVQKSNKALIYRTTLEIPKGSWFPISMRFTQFLSVKPIEALAPAQRTGNSPRYRLYGVIYHHGKFATGGHYTVDLLRQDQSEWLHFDDTQIDAISESGVSVPSPDKTPQDRAAYLLFYQRAPDAVPSAVAKKPRISTGQRGKLSNLS